MQLNTKQLLGIVGAILSALIAGTSQLVDLFGPGVAKNIVSLAALLNSVLSSILVVFNSQGSTVRDVLAMPGVEKIDINGAANQTLAAACGSLIQGQLGCQDSP